MPPSLEPFYPQQYRRYAAPALIALRVLYSWRVAQWLRRLPSRGIALELGCGSGWMLSALRSHGWRVIGTERSVESARIAREAGLPVFVGDIDSLDATGHFDLILMVHVLEHLQDPVSMLLKCARLLKPGGTIVVAVPNAESWQARSAGSEWFHLDIPRHLQHFSPRSLTLALGRAELDPVSLRFVSPELDIYGWLQSWLDLLGFPQHLLTKLLSGMPTRASPATVAGMLLLSIPLTMGSVAVSLASRLAGSGAIMEAWASPALDRRASPRI